MLHPRTSRVVADKWRVQIKEPEPWVWYLIAGLSALALICAIIVVILLCLRCRRKKKKAQQAAQPSSFYDDPQHTASKFRKSESNLSHPPYHHNAPAPFGAPPPMIGYGHNSAFRPASNHTPIAAAAPIIVPAFAPTTGGAPVVLTHLGGHKSSHNRDRRGTKTVVPDVVDNDGYVKEKPIEATTILLGPPTLPAPVVTSAVADAAHIEQTDTWNNPLFKLTPPAPEPFPPPPPRRASFYEKKEPKRVEVDDGDKHFKKSSHKRSTYRERERSPPPPPPPPPRAPAEETEFETTEFETTDAEPIRREIINYVPPTRVETEVHLPARVVEVPVYEESPPQYVVVRERMTETQYQQMLRTGGPDAANHILKPSPTQLRTSSGLGLNGGLTPASLMPTYYG